MTSPHASLPTFRELRQQHGISLEAIYEYAEQDISRDSIQLFDETGRANPYIVDDLLYVLSELSGQVYSRTNVEGITFVLARLPASPTNPQPHNGSLLKQPTLLDLYTAYGLHLDWIGEALKLDNHIIWDMLTEPINPSRQPIAEQFLQIVSQYTGVSYTLENVNVQGL